MHQSPAAGAVDARATECAPNFWQPLFYRWFVEYNPLYLLSAALVLGGCFLWSRGLVHEDGLAGPLGVALVSELYAVALIGGVALLRRIGLRRPAVMLAFLALLYQWDITLHTETCAYLGSTGWWAEIAWMVVFGAKLGGIQRALHVRLDRRASAAALLAAAGLATGPRVLSALGAPGDRWAGALLAVWVFALVALHRGGAISCTEELDGWGRVVLARATRAAWLLSSALLGAHVFFWCWDHHLPLSALWLSAPLYLVGRVRREARVWAVVVATLVLAAVSAPGAFFVVASLAAAALCCRVLAPGFSLPPERSPARAGRPYRARDEDDATANRTASDTTARTLGTGEMARALAGAVFATYLAAWTAGWSTGPWPAHVFALDAAVTVGLAIVAWCTRVWWAMLPLVGAYGHRLLAAHLVPVPRSILAWGQCTVALGFALLAAALLASYSLRARAAPRARADRRL